MRITLRSPAAGHSAGDTAEVPDDYARWLVGQGYAIEAEPKAKPKAEPKAGDDSSARSDDGDAEQASPPRARRRKAASRSADGDAE